MITGLEGTSKQVDLETSISRGPASLSSVEYSSHYSLSRTSFKQILSSSLTKHNKKKSNIEKLPLLSLNVPAVIPMLATAKNVCSHLNG